jgi:putative FmdB family regulatory protein
MATMYTFRCDGCGEFDVRVPMAIVSDTHPCTGCGATSRRVWSAPYVASIAGISNRLGREMTSKARRRKRDQGDEVALSKAVEHRASRG